MLSRVFTRNVRPMMAISTRAFSTPSLSKAIDSEIADFVHDAALDKSLMSKYQAKADIVDDVITFNAVVGKTSVKAVYNAEFTFDEEAEQEEEVEEDAEEDSKAFHEVEILLDGDVSLKLKASLYINGTLEIDQFIPIVNGKDLRPIDINDLSDDVVDGIFNAVEEIGIDNTFADLLVSFARHHRLTHHMESLESLKTFFRNNL